MGQGISRSSNRALGPSGYERWWRLVPATVLMTPASSLGLVGRFVDFQDVVCHLARDGAYLLRQRGADLHRWLALSSACSEPFASPTVQTDR
jgi:hypothetical protein